MKRLMLLACASVIASAAFAQTESSPPDAAAEMAPSPEQDGSEARGPDGGGRDGRGPDRKGRHADRDRGPDRDGRHGQKGEREGPPPSKAAEFHFKRGPLEVRIRCADDEPIKPCVDGGLALMEGFAAIRRRGAGPGAVDEDDLPAPPPMSDDTPPAPLPPPAQ